MHIFTPSTAIAIYNDSMHSHGFLHFPALILLLSRYQFMLLNFVGYYNGGHADPTTNEFYSQRFLARLLENISGS